tara:strand:+ start:279 stop:1058 length:780 start_codon:yes stop_codon:yes gene_type:complete
MRCKICEHKINLIASFSKPQKNEKIFTNLKKFKKKIYKCQKCKHHLINSYNYKLNNKIYKKDYGAKAYGNLKDKFNKIIKLNKNKSSNYHRKKFLFKNLSIKKNHQLLDFGSGLGIFPYSIKKNCKCYFYEKNLFTRDFCIQKLKLEFVSLNNIKKSKYDFITCNKVLEHLDFKDISKCMKIFKSSLKSKGKIYIEVPSTDAAKIGYERQEFYSEHINIFSKSSAKKFFSRCGFTINKLASIKEIGGKFTLRIILSKKL